MNTTNSFCLLKGHDICLRFGYKLILNSVNIAIQKDTTVAIMGPNGGGKTSLIKVLCGIVSPVSGKILKEKNLIIGYMPQKISINAVMPLSVRDFINLYNQQKDKYWQDEVLDIVKINHLLEQNLYSLSSGEMQYVLLARAMIKKPDILIMDEPTNHMDIFAKRNFYKIIKQIKKNSKCSIVCSTHDVFDILHNVDYVFCINQSVCCHGCPNQIRNHPHFMNAFRTGYDV